MTAETFEPAFYVPLNERSILERAVYRRYPKGDGILCEELSPRDRYACTRPEEHDGPHVAHTDNAIALAWWPR